MSLIDVVSAPSREAGPVPSSVDVAIAGWGQLLSRSELAAMLPEFMDVYERRPIRDNFGGMRFNLKPDAKPRGGLPDRSHRE